MKKLYSLTIAAALGLSFAGCTAGNGPITPMSATKVDVKEVCSVEKNGIDSVLASAKVYNAAAKKHGVEFRRLNVNNRDLIKAVEEGISKGAKEVNPLHFKSKPNKVKKSKTKLEINYAAHRACAFGLNALQNKHEGKSTWRLAVPGDGFKL